MTDRAVETVVAAIPAGTGAPEVTGEGPLAAALRARLGAPGSAWHGAAAEPPAVVIETTGEQAAIAAALERVADLGTVVLAGPAAAAAIALDLYRDLHVRGLTVVGVPAQHDAGAAS